MTVFHVTAERGSSGRVWVFQCVEHPGAISQGRGLSEADDLMRETISWVADIDPASIEIELRVALPDDLGERTATVRRMIADLDERQRAVALESRALARDLASQFSGADTARILGVSPQRVSQLVRQ